MVQELKLNNVERPGLQSERVTKPKYGGRRKNAPLQVKKAKEEQKISGAISRNIHNIMTARIAHEGGHLRVLKAPDNVYEYAKGGAKLSERTMMQRAAATGFRKLKVVDREKELRVQLDDAIRKEEKRKLQKLVKQQRSEAEEALQKLQEKREKNRTEIEQIKLVDDDVAGDFFDDVIGDNFAPVIETLRPEEVGAKNAKGKPIVSKKSKAAPKAAAKPKFEPIEKQGPVRRKGIRGLHDDKAMEILDAEF
jgi:hypothetical protein